MAEFELDGAVLLLARSTSPESQETLRLAAAKALNVLTRGVTVRRECGRCGSDDHGQPRVVLDGRVADECSVSFSRAAGHVVAAARVGAQIGIDIESVAQVALHPVENVLLHAVERRTFARLRKRAASRYLAQLWVAKEAVLKLTGDGLRIDPRQLLVRLDGATGRLESWPRDVNLASSPRLSFFSVTDDVVGALAVSP